MSRADVEAGVRAGLEAAQSWLDDHGLESTATYMQIALDPAAIAATVPASESVPLDVHVRLLEELAALRQDAARLQRKIESLRHHVKALQILCKAQHLPVNYEEWCREVDAIDAAMRDDPTA